ncbi:MAG: hypothetical protein QNJ41_04215 [Xenococcaceae cyanobacterium MO_188.B32]|nr:hypothetical protein [Xenococcaceae cyanobacterium MO_188.B32]
MKSFPSEQIPNDGSYQLPRLIDEANERLKQIGKHGKRAIIKVAPKPNKPISAQFSLHGKQTQRGLNLSLNRANLTKAEEICTLITSQLVANTYTDDWLDSLLGKEKPIEQEKMLTCGEMLEIYKKHYFKQRKKNKAPKSTWLTNYRHIEKVMLFHSNESINLQIIREVIDSTENDTLGRAYHLSGLANLLSYFDNKEFKQVIKRYKKENNPKPKKKYIPSDNEITYTYQFGFEPKKNCAKRYLYRYSQWQFLYGLLAVYGLRVHEAWNIKNWDNPVTFKDGDYVAITDDTDDIESENEIGEFSYHRIKEKIVVPAILDPNNEEHLLCIGHETKTGYRVALPVSPHGHSSNCQWIKEFNLIQPLNLPDIENPLQRNIQDIFSCSYKANHWFRRHKYGFTPHALRHAYNIRGHNLGINHKALANSLGHGIIMNSTTYLRNESHESKLQGLKREIRQDNANRGKLKNLESENEKLKDKVKYLEAENEHLKTELKMYEALKGK